MQFKLISFVLCPYVQRAVITLKFKKVPFEIEYIDLKNKPEWFMKLSPLGKVPLLLIDESKTIFESTVINELLDELNPPSTLSTDLIKKAQQRAWIIFADTLFFELSVIIKSQASINSINNLIIRFEKLENVISGTGFFDAQGFSIVDSTYAPLFFRMQYIKGLLTNPKFKALEKIHNWAANLLSQNYVKQSVRDDFEARFKEYANLK